MLFLRFGLLQSGFGLVVKIPYILFAGVGRAVEKEQHDSYGKEDCEEFEAARRWHAGGAL